MAGKKGRSQGMARLVRHVLLVSEPADHLSASGPTLSFHCALVSGRAWMAGVGYSSISSVILLLQRPTWTGLAKRHGLEEDQLSKKFESLRFDCAGTIVNGYSNPYP